AVSRFHLFDALQRHFITYRRYSTQVHPIELPEVKETRTFPLPTMKINQSTAAGNIGILETVMRDTLRSPGERFNDHTRIIVAGDQLTVFRIVSLQELRAADTTNLNQMQWAVPVMQLFHLQMVLCSTILRTHYGFVSTPGPLAYIISMLGRKRLRQDTSNFHAADELIRHTFDAMARRLWEVEFQLDVDNVDMYKCGLESYCELLKSKSDIQDNVFKGVQQ
ncbi:hypothetical protein BGZ54_005709, partial [Gamsiella multidivaricata]